RRPARDHGGRARGARPRRMDGRPLPGPRGARRAAEVAHRQAVAPFLPLPSGARSPSLSGMKSKKRPMRRRAKPAKAKAQAKRPERSAVRRLQKQREEALKRLAEAQEQQTATAEILRVMSTSLAQLQPVLDAIAERGARLCDSSDATIVLSDGEALRME